MDPCTSDKIKLGVIKLSGGDLASRPLALAAAESERGAVVMGKLRNLERHKMAVKPRETTSFFFSLCVFVFSGAFTIKQELDW